MTWLLQKRATGKKKAKPREEEKHFKLSTDFCSITPTHHPEKKEKINVFNSHTSPMLVPSIGLCLNMQVLTFGKVITRKGNLTVKTHTLCN